MSDFMAKVKDFFTDMSEPKLIAVISVAGFILYGGYTGIQSLMAPSAQTGGMVVNPVSSPTTDSSEDKEATQKELTRDQFFRIYRNVPLSNGEKLSPEKAQQLTREIKENPFTRVNKFEYTFQLPEKWEVSAMAKKPIEVTQDEPSFDVLTTIARYYGPAVADMVPFIRTDIIDIPYEMSAAQYLNVYLEERSITAIGQTIHSEERAEVLYLNVIDQSTYAIRTIVIFQGEAAVLFTMAVPIEIYKENESLIGYVINSFKLINDVDEVIEEREKINLLGILQGTYFTSWRLANVKDQSTLKASFQLHNASISDPGLLNGLIEVILIHINPRISLEDEIQERIDIFKERNIHIKELEESTVLKDLALEKGYNIATKEIYSAELIEEVDKEKDIGVVRTEKKITPHEVMFSVLNDGNYILIVTLVSPTASNDYLNWARNVTHFDHIVHNLDIRKRRF